MHYYLLLLPGSDSNAKTSVLGDGMFPKECDKNSWKTLEDKYNSLHFLSYKERYPIIGDALG